MTKKYYCNKCGIEVKGIFWKVPFNKPTTTIEVIHLCIDCKGELFNWLEDQLECEKKS